MAVEPYLPKSDLERQEFLTQFSGALPAHATTLGIAPADVTFVQNSKIFFDYLLSTNVALKRQVNEWVAYKDRFVNEKFGITIGILPTVPTITPPAVVITEPIFSRIALMVKNIKSTPTYNEEIGRELGIIGVEIIEPDLNTVKPQIYVISNANEVIVKWMKDRFTSIDVYIDRGKGRGFEYLANDSRPPFNMLIDLPQGAAPETWTFKVIYRIGDQQVGLYSDPVSIVVRSGL